MVTTVSKTFQKLLYLGRFAVLYGGDVSPKHLPYSKARLLEVVDSVCDPEKPSLAAGKMRQRMLILSGFKDNPLTIIPAWTHPIGLDCPVSRDPSQVSDMFWSRISNHNM